MAFRWLFFVILWPFCEGFCAGPMTHLWVAERFCEIHNITDPRIVQHILLGTEYPDIRYITKRARELTHPNVLDIYEVVKCDSPFEAGIRLHAWVDHIREAYVSPEVYERITPYSEGRSSTLLKFLEEEMLADIYDGRRWSSYFNEVLEEEYSYAEQSEIEKWHWIIQWTMAVRPTNLLWARSYWNPLFGISVDTLYNWSYLILEFKKDPLFQKHMEGFLEMVEDELEKGKEATLDFINKS